MNDRQIRDSPARQFVFERPLTSQEHFQVAVATHGYIAVGGIALHSQGVGTRSIHRQACPSLTGCCMYQSRLLQCMRSTFDGLKAGQGRQARGRSPAVVEGRTRCPPPDSDTQRGRQRCPSRCAHRGAGAMKIRFQGARRWVMSTSVLSIERSISLSEIFYVRT